MPPELSVTESRPTGPSRSAPTGTVTFLFTDIEGSTKLAQHHADAMPALLARHHELLNQAIEANNGFTFRIAGDSFAVAFHVPGEALRAALAIQRALNREAWSPAPIKVRIGIHTGTAQLQDATRPDSYTGYATLAMCQRVMSAGHGGQVLLSQTAADLIRERLPAHVQLKDMGEWRLKDILQPVHLYQVGAPDLPSDFPALMTAGMAHHPLPAQATAFVGRETELGAITDLLSSAQNRLVTIVAPGGMGKTRLALESARQMSRRFPHGLYFVELDRIASADAIVQAVAGLLPISLSSNEDPKTRVLDYLQDKRVLLVMDNFEHVVEGAKFVQDMLRTAPELQILATSRVKLNLMGETLFNIDGLAADEENPEHNSAVQLFAQSARRTQPAFELNEATLPAVRRVCQLVEGMPLAIVLAAAWIDTLSVAEIATEIETSIDILETELRDVSQRQRSVRAVIESAWNQVDASAQDLLKRLAVFRGGFTRAAAQGAAGATLRGLQQLLDKALLRRDPETGRYSIHELLRQYAEDQLKRSTALEQAAHEAHARYFADLSRTVEAHLHDHRMSAALQAIEADLDNIRVAWTYWLAKHDAEHLVAFVGTLWIFFEVRGSYTPAIQFYSDAAQTLTANEPEIICVRAQLRAWQAWFTALIGLPEEGLRIAQESIRILRQHNQAISVETLHTVTINAIFLNNRPIVAQVVQDMLERTSRSDDAWERGWALIWVGYSSVLEQRIPEAIRAGQEALNIFESLNNPFGISVASGLILGLILMAMGEIGQAKAYLARGVQAAEAIHYRRLIQICDDNLGTVALREGDVQQAGQFFLNSLRISHECGQTREMLASLRDFASVSIAQGHVAVALQFLAVVLNHPASGQNSLNRPERLRDEAETLRAQIERQMEPSDYQSTWVAGQKRSLEHVVAQILN